MGWTVLYIAFGVVALWLLGEVLFQYKARLRWRLLAFGGFMFVVLGAVLPQILVIGFGIAAFATGQTFVTLSYRQGFSTGWALGGSPGSSRRRRGPAPREADPSLEVSDLQAHPSGMPPGMPSEPTDAYGYDGYQQPEPATAGATAAPPYGGGDFAGGNHQDGDYYGGGEYGSEYGAYGNQAAGNQPYANPAAETQTYAPQPAGTQAYAYADDQQQYAAYSDPYAGYDSGVSYDPQGNITGQQPAYDTGQQPAYDTGQQPAYDTGQQQPAYDQGYADYGSYADYGYQAPQPSQPSQEQQAAAGWAAPYYPDVPETPPGGVWVPQQRDAAPPPLPPEQPSVPPAPYGYDEEYPQYPNGYYGSDQRTGY
ncbi:hypothetical protein [Streptomyces iconiensis]|uniref:Uncharacterized protein n=1 Tax=Streptomyces iconiensis TaxID=1384038 RepID=A0ABT7A1Y2_9ACTN|nr:hypothetical protein [Streptomyces iconiensis]MDJ1135350.1 hypothetical protein [Streptomyces iconiensis]